MYCITVFELRRKSRRAENLSSEPDFNAAVKNSSLGVRVDLGKTGITVRRENDLTESALPGVGDIFGIDKKAEPAERLFTENAQNPKGSGARPVAQKLAAGVIGF